MRLLIFFIAPLLISCNSQVNPEPYLSQMGVKLTDDYKIQAQKTTSAIGDFGVEFELTISKNDFREIRRRIEEHSEFEEYSENEFSSSPYTSGFSYNSDTVSYSKNGIYHYEIYFDIENGGYELFKLSLENDSTLKFELNEE